MHACTSEMVLRIFELILRILKVFREMKGLNLPAPSPESEGESSMLDSGNWADKIEATQFALFESMSDSGLRHTATCLLRQTAHRDELT